MSEPQYPIWDTDTAAAIAHLAHRGQVDKAGKPYRHHPAFVAFKARQIAVEWGMDEQDVETVVQVAWLHDVLEDTKFTAGILQALGVPMDVLGPVMTLTRSPIKSEAGTARYYRRIKDEPIALVVKQADLWHNLRPERLAALDPTKAASLRTKYRAACEALGLDYDLLAA